MTNSKITLPDITLYCMWCKDGGYHSSVPHTARLMQSDTMIRIEWW